jgi:hypothetical protein
VSRKLFAVVRVAVEPRDNRPGYDIASETHLRFLPLSLHETKEAAEAELKQLDSATILPSTFDVPPRTDLSYWHFGLILATPGLLEHLNTKRYAFPIPSPDARGPIPKFEWSHWWNSVFTHLPPDEQKEICQIVRRYRFYTIIELPFDD